MEFSTSKNFPEPARREPRRPDAPCMAEVLALTEDDARAAFRRLLATFEILSFSEGRRSSLALWKAAHFRAADLRDLFEGIFEYSRTGSIRVYPESTDLVREFDLLGRIFQPHARKQGLELRMDWREGTSRWRLVDAVKLRQVAGHLIVHALKWTTSGRVTFEVSEWEMEQREGVRLTLSAGFEESAWRRGAEADRGLPVIRHLCQLLEASLEIAGPVAGEMRFIFSLPCCRVLP